MKMSLVVNQFTLPFPRFAGFSPSHTPSITTLSYVVILNISRTEENEPEVYEWEQKEWRTQDWVENPQYSKIFQSEPEEDPVEFRYHGDIDLRSFR